MEAASETNVATVAASPSREASSTEATGGRRAAHVNFFPIVTGIVVVALAVALILLASSQLHLRHQLQGLTRQVSGLTQTLSNTNQQTASLDKRLGVVEGKVTTEEEQQKALAQVPSIVGPSTFSVSARANSGTAWVVSATPQRSLLVTAAHVIAPAGLYGQVTIRNSDTAMVGRVEQVDAVSDIALISVPTQLRSLSVNEQLPTVGTTVVVVGSPMGLSGTVTEGTVSAIRSEAGQTYIQFSAPVSPGSSGSPLVDSSGSVRGIVTSKVVAAGAEGISFAVPVSQACAALSVCNR